MKSHHVPLYTLACYGIDDIPHVIQKLPLCTAALNTTIC